MPSDFARILEKNRRKDEKLAEKLHPDDRRRLYMIGLTENKTERQALKSIAGEPGSYTTRPGGKIKKAPSWKSGESVKKRDKRLFTPPY